MPKLWAWDGTANVSSPWIPQQEVNGFMGMIIGWKQLVAHIIHRQTYKSGIHLIFYTPDAV